MKMLFILIILAVVLLSVAVVIFFWAVKQRQFDDLEVHAYSILKEDNYEETTDTDQSKSPNVNTSKNKQLNQTHGEED